MAIEFSQRVAPDARSTRRPTATRRRGPLVRLASNESPYPPLPAVIDAIARSARRRQPLPGPDQRRAARASWPTATACRPRGSPSATAPATSCWRPATRCSSRAPSSIYAWPSFSVYPHLAAASGRAGDRRSRSTATSATTSPAMARERDGRHAAGDRLQPEQPDAAPRSPLAEIAALRRGVPRRRLRDPRRGLLRVQPARRPRRVDRPARAPPEPRAAAHLLQGLRPVRPARRLRAVRRRASSPTRSTRCASRSSATPPRRRRRSRRCATRTPSPTASSGRVDRPHVELDDGLRALGLEAADSQANFCWFDLGEGARRGGDRARAWPSAGVLVRAGGALGRPGALRVTLRHADRERPLPRGRWPSCSEPCGERLAPTRRSICYTSQPPMSSPPAHRSTRRCPRRRGAGCAYRAVRLSWRFS